MFDAMVVVSKTYSSPRPNDMNLTGPPIDLKLHNVKIAWFSTIWVLDSLKDCVCINACSLVSFYKFDQEVSSSAILWSPLLGLALNYKRWWIPTYVLIFVSSLLEANVAKNIARCPTCTAHMKYPSSEDLAIDVAHLRTQLQILQDAVDRMA